MIMYTYVNGLNHEQTFSFIYVPVGHSNAQRTWREWCLSYKFSNFAPRNRWFLVSQGWRRWWWWWWWWLWWWWWWWSVFTGCSTSIRWQVPGYHLLWETHVVRFMTSLSYVIHELYLHFHVTRSPVSPLVSLGSQRLVKSKVMKNIHSLILPQMFDVNELLWLG